MWVCVGAVPCYTHVGLGIAGLMTHRPAVLSYVYVRNAWEYLATLPCKPPQRCVRREGGTGVARGCRSQGA